MPEPMRPARTDLLAAATAAGLRASSPAPVPCARVDASKDCEMPIRAVPLQGDVSWVVVRTLSTAFLRSSRSRAARLLRRRDCISSALSSGSPSTTRTPPWIHGRSTFSQIFKRDMQTPEALARRRAIMIDAVARYVRADRGPEDQAG